MSLLNNSEKVSIGKYLDVVDISNLYASRKTRVYILQNKSGTHLGIIEWYSSWRCYALNVDYIFKDNRPTIYSVYFNAQCLKDITKFIESIKDKRQ